MLACALVCFPCALRAQEVLPNLPASEPAPIIFVSDAVAISKGAILQDRQVKELAGRAENGDSDAAFRLSRHFDAKKDFLKYRYWLLIAALGGDSIAQYNMWFLLRESHHCAEMGEALAWLESSTKLGSVMARDQLDAYRSKVKVCTPDLP